MCQHRTNQRRMYQEAAKNIKAYKPYCFACIFLFLSCIPIKKCGVVSLGIGFDRLTACSWYGAKWVKHREVAKIFAVTDYVREMNAKKSCKHGECGLFEHLFFFLPVLFSQSRRGLVITSYFSYKLDVVSNYFMHCFCRSEEGRLSEAPCLCEQLLTDELPIRGETFTQWSTAFEPPHWPSG